MLVESCYLILNSDIWSRSEVQLKGDYFNQILVVGFL